MPMILIYFLKYLIVFAIILFCVAYSTHVERKILGTVQRRQGPNVVGTYGLLQPFTDGFKLVVKEIIRPSNADIILYFVAPAMTFAVAIICWAVIPFNVFASYITINLSLLYLLASSSLGIYGIILAGWASNSKYAFLGALRSAAQMISYEIPITLSILSVGLLTGSLNLNDIVISQAGCWNIYFMSGLCLIIFICALAETNRHPFDLPEAEAELVSGYNTEFSSIAFALFFLAEYANMLLMSVLIVILFFGGWLAPWETATNLYNNLYLGSFMLGIKSSFVFILFAWMRVSLPRYRYDQLMSLGWKQLFPLCLVLFLVILVGLTLSDGLPPTS